MIDHIQCGGVQAVLAVALFAACAVNLMLLCGRL
jgi:hypothetical protein